MAVTGGRASGTSANNTQVASGTSGVHVSQREDLANFISMITRDETPFMSSIGTSKATSIYHEWQTDALQAPGNSRIAEGTDYIVPGDTSANLGGSSGESVGGQFAITGPNRERLGNYCQINGKSLAISGTKRSIDQAGVADEYAYQLKKRGTELRRDMEHDMIHSYQAASGSGARQAGSIHSWLNTNVSIYNGVTNAAQNGGTGRGYSGTAITDVTMDVLRSSATSGTSALTRSALSLADIDQLMQNIYEEGGKATRIMLSPKLRRDFSDLMVTDSGVRRNLDEKGKLRQSVDVYMSDFGDLMVVPNYIMGLSNNLRFSNNASTAAALAADTDVADFSAIVYDPQWFSKVTLRPLQELDIGQRGDSTVGMMVEEWSLECKNPVGCGAIYGLE